MSENSFQGIEASDISVAKRLNVPKYTTTQRDAIANPALGLVIYNTTTNKLNVYTGSWEAVTSA